MRKLSVVMAALFLLGSVPAFAQTSGGTTESGAAAAGDAGSETGAKEGTKKHAKKAKKGAKKKKKEAADAGM